MDRMLSYSEAIREATDQEMSKDENVFVLGIGVDDFKAVYGTTRGLVEKYGRQRVMDTPLSEDGMTGLAIGAAMAGMRPIHVHIRMDFLMLSMNQLVNIAAKSRYMYGGRVRVPIVVRAVIGRSWGQGAQHSQGLHSFFMHVPGLRVFAPSTPYDAKGCLLTAIREDNPVIFVEHRMLHALQGHVPEEPYTVPFGRARVLVRGDDVTLVGISHMAIECLRAQKALAEAGVSAEVIDPVSLSPLDMDTIGQSANRTGRLIVVDAGWSACGAAAEIVARVAESAGAAAAVDGARPVRVQRLGFEPVPCPTTKNLENLFYPDAPRIASAAYALVHGPRGKVWTPSRTEAHEITAFRGPF